jgi:hypothetical protein
MADRVIDGRLQAANPDQSARLGLQKTKGATEAAPLRLNVEASEVTS